MAYRDAEKLQAVKLLSQSYYSDDLNLQAEAKQKLEREHVRKEYQRCVREYTQKPYLRVLGSKTKGYDLAIDHVLDKVIKISRSMAVSYRVYFQAQFYFFHKWYSRYPRIQETIGNTGNFNYAKRLTEYIKLEKPEVPRSPVLPTSTKVKPDDLSKVNEARVTELQQAWGMERDEVFRQFAFSGIFDRVWLQRQPEYRKFLS